MSSAPVRRIVAVGGGGFTVEPRDHALEAHIAALTGRERPRVCLLPTASGDPEAQIERFNAAFRRLGCRTSHVSLFRLGDRPLAVAEHLLAQDAIYVGGGSLLNLVAIWRAHGLDRVLRRAWERGILLAGVSAGSMCWFEHGITTSTGEPGPAAGLGFLEGSNCVHYDAQRERAPVFHLCLQEGLMPGGWAVDDGAALVFEGAQLAEAVTARPGAGARRVDCFAGTIVERALAARLLADPEPELGADPSLSELRELRARRSPGWTHVPIRSR